MEKLTFVYLCLTTVTLNIKRVLRMVWDPAGV